MTALAYRLAAEPDLGFVFDSWINSYRDAHAAGMIAYEDWAAVMRQAIERVLARDGCELYVAHHPGEDDGKTDLYGWAALEGQLVHYVYVKRPFRRLGIARGLLGAGKVQPRFSYTCKTIIVSQLREAMPGARWTPLTARKPRKTP